MSLTTDQVKALTHPDWLSSAAVAGFSAIQVPVISLNWQWMNAVWLNALSGSAFAAIPQAGIAQIPKSVLAGLDASHIAALTKDQGSALTAVQVGGFSTAQIESLTDAQMAGLTDAQLNVKDAFGNTLLSDKQAKQDAKKYTMTQVQNAPAALIKSLGIPQLSAMDSQGNVVLFDLAASSSAADNLSANQMSYSAIFNALQSFSRTIGVNGISNDQVTFFNNLVATAGKINGASSYVASLLKSVINGGLKTGTTQSDYDTLVNQWFLGANNPTARPGYSLVVNSSALFPTNLATAYSNVLQGGATADCYFIAALISTAQMNPASLSSINRSVRAIRLRRRFLTAKPALQ